MGKLRLLLLEDMISDAELIIRSLERSGMQFSVVIAHDSMEFINALDEQDFDVILADNTLPQFSANEALMIINKREIDIPFILVTGSISEEYAVAMMKDGTWDYILKDRLQRLPNAILNAWHKYKLDADRKKYLEEVVANGALLKEASRMAKFGSWEADLVRNTGRWSDEQYRILGFDPGEVEPTTENFLSRIHPDDRGNVRNVMEEAARTSETRRYDFRLTNDGNALKYIAAEMVATRNEQGKLLRLNGFIQDVTNAKEAELKEKKITADLLQRYQDLEQFAYIISHNLRGPVANIVGITDALLDESIDENEKESFVDALATSVKNLDNIIIDLNNIVQVKQHINENKECVVFSKIVDEIKCDFKNVISDKGIKFTCDFSEVDCLLTLKSYLHSVFYNLISNSIKFRQKDVDLLIEIKSYRENNNIVLRFRDNGVGIDLDKRSKYVFGLYKRFHPEYAEGKGMGLFMVKTQVVALGGKIQVHSKVNEGTEFIIEFEQQNITN